MTVSHILQPVASMKGASIAQLADMPRVLLATTFLVGGPPNPKDPGFGGFIPIAEFLATKNPFNGFFELNHVVFRTPQITYLRDA